MRNLLVVVFFSFCGAKARHSNWQMQNLTPPIEKDRYYYAEELLHHEACLLISIIHIEPYTLICMALLLFKSHIQSFYSPPTKVERIFLNINILIFIFQTFESVCALQTLHHSNNSDPCLHPWTPPSRNSRSTTRALENDLLSATPLHVSAQTV